MQGEMRSTAMRIAKSYLNPVYAVECTEHVTEPRVAWWAVPEKRWAYHLKRMMFDTTISLDGIQVYRTYCKYMVEGETLNLMKTVAAMKSIQLKMVEEKYKPLPYFKLTLNQKKLLRYWIDFRAENGVYPNVRMTTIQVGICDQQVSNIMHTLMGLGLVSKRELDALGAWEWQIEEEALKQMGLKI